MSVTTNERLLELLQESGYLKKDQIDSVLTIAKRNNRNLEDILMEEGIVTEEEIIEVLSLCTGSPRVRLNKMYLCREIAKLIPEYYARKYTAFPVKKDGNTLMIALRDPRDILAIDDIRMATGLNLQIVIATKSEIERAIERFYGKKDPEISYFEEDKAFISDEADKLTETDKVPIIRIVNTLIHQAVIKGASDIHIEPQERNVLVRYRIDGLLSKVMTFSKAQLAPVITRIKIMANLDITTRRLPQDGRFNLNIDDQYIDIRVSIMPTINGEKVVLRLLNRNKHLLNLDQLGFNKVQVKHIKQMLDKPNGIILVTGPTGSGKTTTLYSMLNAVNIPTKNIMTLEDPVEYAIPGINQVQINPKAGITFAKGLRALLRQDPNIIMVGEIRDSETAKIAIRAALTGHLVFSTLHTNDASGAVNRLLDMGVESYLLASCLVGVISQRLVKKICPHCREKEKFSERDDNIVFFKGKGCSFCNFSGYKGRIAVGEIITIHEKHKSLILKQASSSHFDRVSRDLGFKNLLDNGMELVKNGTISYGELVGYS